MFFLWHFRQSIPKRTNSNPIPAPLKEFHPSSYFDWMAFRGAKTGGNGKRLDTVSIKKIAEDQKWAKVQDLAERLLYEGQTCVQGRGVKHSTKPGAWWGGGFEKNWQTPNSHTVLQSLKNKAQSPENNHPKKIKKTSSSGVGETWMQSLEVLRECNECSGVDGIAGQAKKKNSKQGNTIAVLFASGHSGCQAVGLGIPAGPTEGKCSRRGGGVASPPAFIFWSETEN